MNRSVGKILRNCLLLAVAGLTPVLASAEFIKTSTAIFQHTNLQHRVVITEKGILFVETDPMPIQLFDPTVLEAEKARHGFLSFDPASNRYDTISFGENSYRINGSFNLRLGKLLVKVDQNNPYVSFIVDDPDLAAQQQGVLGLLGLTVVVNAKGVEFLTMLQANNDFGELQSLIKDYHEKEGFLHIDQSKVPTSTAVGIATVQPDRTNPCLLKDTVILTKTDLEKIRIWHRKGGQRETSQIEKLFSERQDQRLLDQLLILRVDKESVAGLDFLDSSLKIIKPLKTKSPKWRICLIEHVAIE